MSLLYETILIAVMLASAFYAPRIACKWFHMVSRELRCIARRRGLSVALMGFLGLMESAALSLLTHIPEPKIHDEFSYLLAADTFARGRLTNPTHPMWMHFESLHIIQQPTYASIYPPAQGLMLAVGQVVGGHPSVGVWISIGIACAAICWMLQAWLPPHWALLGALLVLVRVGLSGSAGGTLGYWSQSYWGGAMAATGGALVFGSLRRIVCRPRVRNAVLLGLGLAVLANSRPYEGFIVSLPAAAMLMVSMVGKSTPVMRVSIRSVALPIFVVLVLTAGAMGYYNLRVTGDPLRLAHLLAYETYGVVPVFLWQHPKPEPLYHHKVMRDFYTGWGIKSYMRQYSIAGIVRGVEKQSRILGKFYLGLLLTVPLITLPWVLKDRWMRLAFWTCAMLMAAFLMHTWVFPHYAAPITGLIFALVLQAMRHLRLWRWHGRPTGRFIVQMIPVLCIALLVPLFVQKMQVDPDTWNLQRVRLLKQLKEDGGRHLVIVRYGPEHSLEEEWVYNEADIDGAKVVWAREMDAAQNRGLLDYFQDRQVWLLEADAQEPKLVPYLLVRDSAMHSERPDQEALAHGVK
jgi:hypothetical protein